MNERTATGDPRVIKKYPNRRLYDTAESRYITLADVRRLVVERVEFIVIDKKTQEDITRSILLQVISEQEGVTDPVLSRDFLSQVIRSYGGAMHGVMGSYLEQSVKIFGAQQREIRERVKSVVGMDPVETIAQITQDNYQRWRAVQDDIFRALMSGAASRASAAPDREDRASHEPDDPDAPQARR